MSKYVILVLINLPLLTIGILEALSAYKTKRTSRRRCVVSVIFWVSLGAMFVLVEPFYNTLVRFNLTNSTPMSIFDMVLLTATLFCLFLIKKSNENISRLNRKIARLHESIVIGEERKSAQPQEKENL